MRLSDRIPRKYIDAAEKAGACSEALDWLREVPRTWRQLKDEHSGWLLFGCKIDIPYPSEWIDECAKQSPEAALEFAAKHLLSGRLDWCAEKYPWMALLFAYYLLSLERLDWCAEKYPWMALVHTSRYLTPERLDWCAEREPQMALSYASGFLTPERKKWCEEHLQ